MRGCEAVEQTKGCCGLARTWTPRALQLTANLQHSLPPPPPAKKERRIPRKPCPTFFLRFSAACLHLHHQCRFLLAIDKVAPIELS